jgi:hypothetical protein
VDLQDGGFVAGFFLAIRSLEAILGKLFFHNNAKDKIEDIKDMIEAHQKKIYYAIDEQKDLLHSVKRHGDTEDKIFNRLESVLETVADSTKELSIILKHFIDNERRRGNS